jgi:hypothetical protein
MYRRTLVYPAVFALQNENTEGKDQYQSFVWKVLVLSPGLYIDIRKLTSEK